MIYRPKNPQELQSIIAEFYGQKSGCEIICHGTKRALNNNQNPYPILNTSELSGVVDYDSGELILVVKPATPLREIQDLLAKNGQYLPFDPPVYNQDAISPSIGGVMLSGFSGSRRLRMGGARDYLLGFSAINGRAEDYHCGARVVKNVTGYDMMKLICGSFGTLSVVHELIIKTWPKPQAQQSLQLTMADLNQAMKICHAVLATPWEVMGASYDGKLLTFLLEGTENSVQYRITQLQEMLKPAQFYWLNQEKSQEFWQDTTNLTHLFKHDFVFRCAITPSYCAEFIANLQKLSDKFDYIIDWGGGLANIGTNDENLAKQLRLAIPNDKNQQICGHAVLIKSPKNCKIAVFQPQSSAITQLESRIRLAFDPENILNPNRMT